MKTGSIALLLGGWLYFSGLVNSLASPPGAGASSAAQPTVELGRIEFPVTTSSAAAREHFGRGVLALHSFFYDEALAEFGAALKLEPSFAMASWGEAMANNETIWEWQDLEAGRQALARIKDTTRLNPKEEELIAAVRLLYGEGERPHRSAAYAAAMQRLQTRWPDDDEVTTFTALALLGTIGLTDPAVATRMRAGAMALGVLAKNPLHPGAAHYIIHSFDDPAHAILALPAAQRYARIAPEAFHARHMPAHIFVQLGMWDAAVASCESAWTASQRWVARHQHPLTKADFHSLNWLVSLHLQQGRPQQAAAVLQTFRDAIAKENRGPMRLGYSRAVLAFLQESGTWERTAEYLTPLDKPESLTAEERAVACHPTAGNPPAGVAGQLSVLTVRSYAAALRGDDRAVRELQAQTAKLQAKLGSRKPGDEQRQLDEAALQGFLALGHKQPAAAAQKFNQAAALDDRLGGNTYADPGLIPWEEEAGLAFVLAGKPKEAGEAFTAALAKRPGRTRSLLGAARAAERRGDRAAAAEYAAHAHENLHNAEPTAPGLAGTRRAGGAP